MKEVKKPRREAKKGQKRRKNIRVCPLFIHDMKEKLLNVAMDCATVRIYFTISKIFEINP